MTTNLRIVAVNAVDTAALSSSDFAAGLPVSNLQVEGRARVARTVNATGSKVVLGTFAAASAASACILYRNNLTSEGTWRLELWDNVNQTGTKVYDSGNVLALQALGWGEFGWGMEPWGADVFTGWPVAFSVMWFPSVGARSFRLTLIDPANPEGCIQAKRLVIGQAFEPSQNMSYGLRLQWAENSVQTRTAGNSIRTDPMSAFRQLSGTLGHLPPGERAQFIEIARKVGMRNEIFISVFPEVGGAKERDYSMLGKFTSMPQSSHLRVDGWDAAFTIQEV